ncbi:MAG: LPS assembly lipoprotein LptE [Marinobacter sp.]|uniref:LPS-assembly lipoprotein LptE n=1 Tax=Marinobacter sp. TaxID=50741 RepID=UPI00299D610A|nr:LPS assembly lipoprotein LptE [Marinobacter sp.]MDX1756757.1 LPS assembly lipoprotein LptE [Marinobacter sp.]
MGRSTDRPSLPTALAIVGLSILLSACGFHLRGAAPVSAALQPLAVACSDDIPAPLCATVKDQLELGGVELAQGDQADYTLRLTRFEQSRRASAITLQGSAAEYDLRQRVWMDVMAAGNLPLVAEAEVRSSETFRYDEANVLAKRREQQEVEETLYQRLAQQILFRLTPLTEPRINTLKQQATDAANQHQGTTP